MSNTSKQFLTGALLITLGLITLATSPYVAPEGTFEDSYPVDEEWGVSGTHDNTLSDADGNLVLDDHNEPGTFTSDILDKEQLIEFQRIVYESNEIKPSQNKEIDLTVYGYKDDAVEEDRVIEIRENGRFSKSLGNLSNNIYDSYSFEAELRTDTSQSPELNELVLSGRTYQNDDPLSFGIFVILFFLGCLKMLNAIRET